MKTDANRPVGGIPIVTIGNTLYKGLFFKHNKNIRRLLVA